MKKIWAMVIAGVALFAIAIVTSFLVIFSDVKDWWLIAIFVVCFLTSWTLFLKADWAVKKRIDAHNQKSRQTSLELFGVLENMTKPVNHEPSPENNGTTIGRRFAKDESENNS
jgi:c-di-AMP phosphodiesterase-like protein